MSFMSNVFDPRRHSLYEPINPEKYIGNSKPVIRSSYEAKFCRWLDSNDNVLEWASEEIEILYNDPIKKGKIRRYFPDFYMKVKNKNGLIVKYIIEIKPYKETKMPKNLSKSVNRKKRENLIYENIVWQKNQAKWKAAIEWCKIHDCEFSIVTEKQLFK